MRIAFVSDAVYPYNKGGKEIRLYEIAKRLKEHGHEIHIYTMKWWNGPKIQIKEGIVYHGVSKFYVLYNKDGKRSIKQALFFSSSLFQNLIQEDFDILDVDQMPYFPIFPCWLVSKIRSKPMVVTWHEKWGTYWFEYLTWWGIFGYLIEKAGEFFSPKIIAVSEETYKRMNNKEKILVPNGVDISTINTLSPNQEKYELLYAGRLIKEKNVDLLVHCANKKKYKTLIIGSGPEEKYLRKIAKNNITFKDFLQDHKEIFRYMKSAKVFVNLSQREGFSMSMLEALACGTPVITSNHKDNAGKSLINSKVNGYISGLTNKEIEEAVDFCLKRNSSMKEAAASSVESFSWEKIVKKIEEVYRDE